MKPTDDRELDFTEESSVFETVSDVDVSRSDKYKNKIEKSILAPFRILWSDWRGKAGLITVLLFLFMGTAGVVLYPEPASDPQLTYLQPLHSLEYPLGTDAGGRDLLGMTIYATPPMLKMVLAGGVFATAVGTIVGMVAGYKGGRLDQVLMLFTDMLMTLPGLPLVIVLAFIFEPRSPYLIGLILSVNRWTGLARAIRSQMLPLRDVAYVQNSRIMGISTPILLWKDIMPNIMPFVLISFVGASRQIIFDSVALYYLGVLPSTEPNWGVMMNEAHQTGGALYSWDAAHWMLLPMLAVVFFSFGFIMISQSADRLFNPRIRSRHVKDEADEPAEIEH